MPYMPMDKLLPLEILDAMPRLGDCSQKKSEEITIPLKLFDAMGSATWFCYEYDPEARIFFCFANLGYDMNAELGTVSLDELLESVPMLERDFYWDTDTTLKQVMDFEKR